MKILVVSNLYPPVGRGGYERECAAVTARLRESHDVTVLTSRLHRELASSDERDVRRELPFLEYSKRDSLRAPGWAIHAARSTLRALAELDPDLVFVWNGAQIPHSALRVVLDDGQPIAFRICELWFGRLLSGDRFIRHLVPGDTGIRAVWAAGMRAVNLHPALRIDPYRRARAAISWNSESTRRLSGIPPAVEPVLERVLHSTSPYVSEFAQVRRAPSRDRVTIAFVGRVDEAKGADVAALALRYLRDRYGIDATLQLVGTDADGVGARLAALTPSVEMLGQRPPRDVARMLSGAHALVIPSTVPEGLPLVCIEGALAQVPIVASDIGGIPECLRHEDHAVLVAPGDPDALAAGLARVLSEHEETEARVLRARAHVENFSLAGYLEASERFVEDAAAALGRRTRRRRDVGAPRDASAAAVPRRSRA